jgi:hypothetical protein
VPPRKAIRSISASPQTRRFDGNTTYMSSLVT